MSTDQLDGAVTYLAGSDLSASQFCAVNLNSSGQLALPSAGGRIVGVLYSKPTAQGVAAEVQTGAGRVVKWKLGGTVAKGDSVKVDTSGRIVTASAGDVSAGAEVGICTHGGAINEIGAAQLTGRGLVASLPIETLTGAGAVSVSTDITDWVATSDNATLADGRYVGQLKKVRAAAGTTGSNILTPATVTTDTSGGTTPATFTFTDEGQEVDLRWTATGWKCVGLKQAGQATVAAGGTANPLIAKNNLATDGTDVATLASGIFPGQKTYFTVISVANTPIQTISGLFFDEDGSADGITVNFVAAAIAVGNMFRGEWAGARWAMVNHVNATITT